MIQNHAYTKPHVEYIIRDIIPLPNIFSTADTKDVNSLLARSGFTNDPLNVIGVFLGFSPRLSGLLGTA